MFLNEQGFAREFISLLAFLAICQITSTHFAMFYWNLIKCLILHLVVFRSLLCSKVSPSLRMLNEGLILSESVNQQAASRKPRTSADRSGIKRKSLKQKIYKITHGQNLMDLENFSKVNTSVVFKTT